MSAGERICLVDGTNMFFRAFHALPPLTTRKGLPTGAIYGFAAMLAKLIRESPDATIVVVVDAKGKTFRSKIDPNYKAHRKPTPPELVEQIPWIKKMVPALGLPLVEVAGVEADDVIGTLATQADARGLAVDIVTSDKDMMQLVGERVQLVDTMNDRVSRLPEVEKKFGTTPGKVVEVQGLMGDAVDNIPGVKGIGEKTAKCLIQHFGTIAAVYDGLDEIADLGLRGAAGIRKKLEAGRADAERSRELATIKCDVEIDLDLEAFARREIEADELQPLVAELEFAKLLGGLLDSAAPVTAAVAPPSEEVGAADFCNALLGEKDGALALGEDEAGAVAVLARADEVLVCAELPTGLVAALEGDKGGTLFVDGLKEILHATGAAAAATPAGARPLHDLRIASYVLDPSRRGHDLDGLLRERGVPTPPPATEVSARERATAIAVATAALGPTLIAEVEAGGLMALYRDLEMPLVRTLAAMEARGIGADAGLLEAAGRDFSARVALLEVEIHEIAGEEFNIASTKQLRSILFEKLGLPTKGVKKGKTGYSVDADVLAKLAEQSPIAQKIVEYRTLSKLNSTYVAGLLGLIEAETGRVHTSFNQTVTATGRLSSSDPNLQNIPVRTEEGRRIRHAFVAGPGQVFLAADYSQIELRVLAHLTEDPVLVEAFGKGEDIHRRTAAEVFDVDPVFVSADMRRQAKVINFGILYGMGPQRLSRELAISRVDATGIIERYFERYASVRAFVESVVEGGRETGYVETMLGRRRPLPDLISNRAGLRQAAERMAWNSPIQGTAADIIKLAMLEVERRLRRSNSAAAMLLQVHDELFFEIPEEGAEELGELVRDAMENVVALAVPLVVDLKKGLNWAELS
jgi:DNA polymerase-1